MSPARVFVAEIDSNSVPFMSPSDWAKVGKVIRVRLLIELVAIICTIFYFFLIFFSSERLFY